MLHFAILRHLFSDLSSNIIKLTPRIKAFLQKLPLKPKEQPSAHERATVLGFATHKHIVHFYYLFLQRQLITFIVLMSALISRSTLFSSVHP